MTTRPTDWNEAVIKEFRENSGKVGGNFTGAPVLLLHTKGAKTGQERVNPLMYLKDGDRWVIFASKGGAPTNPDWFHNLKTHSDAIIEVGTDTIEVRAEVAESRERDRLYAMQAERYPQFAEYERKTTRKIPAVLLTRR